MAWRAFPPDNLATAHADTIKEIGDYANPRRRLRIYPRVVKRYRVHHHRIKRPADVGVTYDAPPKIHIFKLIA